MAPTPSRDSDKGGFVSVKVDTTKPDNQGEFIDNSNKADRFNDGKRKWSLVDFKSLEPMVEVLEYGAKKYSPENWKKGLDQKEILESMMRHLTALMDGEKLDSESTKLHMGHIQCNAMFWNYFERKNCCGNWDADGKCKCDIIK